jgi:hypothetical protein
MVKLVPVSKKFPESENVAVPVVVSPSAATEAERLSVKTAVEVSTGSPRM